MEQPKEALFCFSRGSATAAALCANSQSLAISRGVLEVSVAIEAMLSSIRSMGSASRKPEHCCPSPEDAELTEGNHPLRENFKVAAPLSKGIASGLHVERKAASSCHPIHAFMLFQRRKFRDRTYKYPQSEMRSKAAAVVGFPIGILSWIPISHASYNTPTRLLIDSPAKS